jgi:quercetin dioxygenase-like cupin family protein
MSLRVRKLSEEPGINEQEEGFSRVNTVWAVLKRTDLTGFSSRIFRMESGGHTATHTHDREHVAVVVSGTCKVEGGEDTAEVGAGSVITVPRNLPHKFSNPGPRRLVLLIMNFFMCDEKDEMATSDGKPHRDEEA